MNIVSNACTSSKAPVEYATIENVEDGWLVTKPNEESILLECSDDVFDLILKSDCAFFTHDIEHVYHETEINCFSASEPSKEEEDDQLKYEDVYIAAWDKAATFSHETPELLAKRRENLVWRNRKEGVA